MREKLETKHHFAVVFVIKKLVIVVYAQLVKKIRSQWSIVDTTVLQSK